MGQKNKGKHLSARLNILFLITFILFSALVFRLGFIQIVHGEDYQKQTEYNSVKKVAVEAPRGWIMDRNGEIMVYNEVGYTVTYTNSGQKNLESIAEKLSTHINMDKKKILEIMETAESFAPVRIKQNLSTEEWLRVSEHLHELPGIDIVEDPIRAYHKPELFGTYLGKVGPIRTEDWSYYQTKGYRMNEWVGTSYLEYQYEDQLRGKEGSYEVVVDKSQRRIGEPVYNQGERGNDLVLTIDLKLQEAIEKAIAEEKEHELVNDAFFVAMDPRTGEILGMSNDHRTVGAGQNSYAAGSTVKMATVLMGLHEGIVTKDTIIADKAGGIQIGNVTKRSWRRTGLGNVNALTALQKSSNIYMFHIGLRLANYSGGKYYDKKAFDTAFYYFSQFGLGVKTGIDLPNEYEGYKSNDDRLGLLADFMIGQYHNYTPLQLAQYVSTIANGGYRMQPYLVKEIRRGVPNEDELGQVIMKREPTILNRVDMSDEHIQIVKRGMEMVTEPNGTAYGIFGKYPIKIAAKTGTAQTMNPDGTFGLNNTLIVGYAPADNPTIAFACIVPQSQNGQSQNNIAHSQVITKKVLDVYFGLNSAQNISANDEGILPDEQEAEETNN